MAMNQKLLLVSFEASHRKHNQRLEKLLCRSFIIEQFSFTHSTSEQIKKTSNRVQFSRLVHLLSVPTIGFVVGLHEVLAFFLLKPKRDNFLSESIQDYFDGSRKMITLILHLNRTLRQQKIRVLRSNQVISLAAEGKVDCVLLPEDNNFYASGILIIGLQKHGIRVGVIDFTIGKEAEFKVTRRQLVPDGNFLPHLIFAKLFLKSSTRERWIKTREFINIFPGSLETISHNSLTPAFESGLADFYLSSDVSELAYLKRLASIKAQVQLIEPIEVTLSKVDARSTKERDLFGLFLPPNQLSDPSVVSRIGDTWGNDYETIIFKILEDVQSSCLNPENLIIFPHPRAYLSNPDLMQKISRVFRVSDDFADYLGVMRNAIIFSSAVFSALLAANVKVFNLDLFDYGYTGVFPVDNPNFVTINEIKEIRNLSHCPECSRPQSSVPDRSALRFLEEFL